MKNIRSLLFLGLIAVVGGTAIRGRRIAAIALF